LGDKRNMIDDELTDDSVLADIVHDERRKVILKKHSGIFNVTHNTFHLLER